jgi:hypothetical protein
MLHDGREFSPKELKANFARVDRKLAEWGITQAATINAHFGEVGRNAVPFLVKRGVRFTMDPGVLLGSTWAHAAEGASRDWNPWPYGHHGFNYDVVPGCPELFNAVAHPVGRYKLHEQGMGTSDFLWWKTTFWEESPFNDIDGAAEKGAQILKLGLDGGFFGCLMTHEQRIATLSLSEWEQVLDSIDRLTSRWDKTFASYDHIAEYARCKHRTRLVEARLEGKKLRLRLVGEATLPLSAYVFWDESGEYRIERIPPFDGETEVVVG